MNNRDNISRIVTSEAEHAQNAAEAARAASMCAAVVLLINHKGGLSLSTAGVPREKLLSVLAGVVAELAQAQQPKPAASPIILPPGVM